jgi:8-oxo-dGTP pyrophosphatase MutT (NUDIX family)
MLLVSGKGSKSYWTPGGKVDLGESVESALRREINEELGVNVKSMKIIFSKKMINTISGVENDFIYYLVDIIGTIKPSAEIDRIIWLSSSEFHEGKIKVTEGVSKCMNFLIKNKLI